MVGWVCSSVFLSLIEQGLDFSLHHSYGHLHLFAGIKSMLLAIAREKIVNDNPASLDYTLKFIFCAILFTKPSLTVSKMLLDS